MNKYKNVDVDLYKHSQITILQKYYQVQYFGQRSQKSQL